MHYTLDILEHHRSMPPPPGQLLVSVARHDDRAERFPIHVEERARVLRQLDDVTGVQVTDWGYTDTEVEDVLLELATTGISAFAAIVSAWIPAYAFFSRDRDKRRTGQADARGQDEVGEQEEERQTPSRPPNGDSGSNQQAEANEQTKGVAGFTVQKPDGSFISFTMMENMTQEERRAALVEFLRS